MICKEKVITEEILKFLKENMVRDPHCTLGHQKEKVEIVS